MSYTGKDQTPELTYPLIKRAVYGDEAALEVILRHFLAVCANILTQHFGD